MKKLLALLGVTTLVTSASVAVVACKSTDLEVDSQNDNDIEFRELLNNFKTEITQRFNDNYNKNVNNFSLFNEDSRIENYKFLNLQNLAKIGTNDEYILNRTEFLDFLNDINLLLNVDNLKSNINQLASEPEYNLLTNGLNNNIFAGFEIKNNQISLEINEDQTYGLAVNLRFELILNFNYLKKGEIETESLNAKQLSFSIINDAKIDEVIQNIINNLGKELYKGEDSPLYFTDEKLAMGDEAFKENISGEVNDYILATDFKDPLSNVIADIASISNMEESIGINFNKLNSSEVSWNKQFVEINSANATTLKSDSDLVKILTNPNVKDYSYEQRIQIIERTYSNELDDTYFRTNLDSFLAQNNLNQETKENYDSILGYGNFDISNIILLAGGSEYFVPTLSLVFDYSVEEFKREDYSSQILNSISAFQNAYQIEYSENSFFTIKNEYFWTQMDKRNNLGRPFNHYKLNQITANYSLYQINELSFDIGKEAKFGPEGFNFYFDSQDGTWTNSNKEGVKTLVKLSTDNRVNLQLGTFFIVINITGDELELLNSGEWSYFSR